MRGRLLLCLLCFLTACGVSLFAGSDRKLARDPAKMSAKEFMDAVRNPPFRRSWALLQGEAVHKRKGAASLRAPLRIGILFTPARTLAQIDFDKGEIYHVGQSYGAKGTTTLENMFPKVRKPRIGIFGIDPTDLSMSFLYYDLVKEGKNESVRTLPCRVFYLKKKGSPIFIRAVIARDYLFPLKVEFFAGEGRKPYKKLEVTAFQKKGEYYHPDRIRLEGENWKSMVSFSEMDAGPMDKSLPANLFRKVNK